MPLPRALGFVAASILGFGAAPYVAAGAADAAVATIAADAAWQVVGRQGLLAHVIVPAAQARDRGAYQRQVPVLCGTRETCFVNFYTNSTGAAAALPLPDAVSGEATAVLRRSAKQGVLDGFRWSCRMAMPEPNCF